MFSIEEFYSTLKINNVGVENKGNGVLYLKSSPYVPPEPKPPKPVVTKFEIHTYKSSAEQNRVDKTNFLTADMIISGVLREASSLIHPSITFTSDIIPKFNYVYIPLFNRYYYVTDITSIKNKLWQMSLTVDVLMTYKEALLACTGYIDRNENEYNGLIPDNMISLEKGETIETVALNNELFISNKGSYVIQGLLIGAGDEYNPNAPGNEGQNPEDIHRE